MTVGTGAALGVGWSSGWRVWLLTAAVLEALISLAELAVWAHWHFRGSPAQVEFEFHPDGRLARIHERQLRFCGSEFELHLRPDGAVDHARSWRSFRGVLRLPIREATVTRFASNAVWGALDGAGITWWLQDIYKASGRLPDALTLHPGARRHLGPRVAPDRWGRPYLYEAPTGEHPARITTLGRDGAPGGAGDDADWTGTFNANGSSEFEWPLYDLRP